MGAPENGAFFFTNCFILVRNTFKAEHFEKACLLRLEKSKIILEVKDMERLQKVIAHAGLRRRRKAEELIKEGRVKVNGKVVTELGVKVTSSDQIEVNGVKG